MTIVVYRDGIIAADTLATRGDAADGFVNKIFRGKEFVVGMCGNTEPAQRMSDWVLGGEKKKRKPYFDPEDEFGILKILDKDHKKAYVYDNGIFPLEYYDDFFAIGSGFRAGLTACEMGATAIEAVEAVIKRDVGCGGPVTWIDTNKGGKSYLLDSTSFRR